MIRDEQREENSRKIARAMTELTAHQREFIFLRFYQQLSYEEISSIMDISVKAVYKLAARAIHRSEEHTSELQSLMRISYAVFCFKKKTSKNTIYYLY